MSPEVDEWVSAVSAARRAYRFPTWAEAAANEFVASCLALLFPQFAPHGRSDPHAVHSEVRQLKSLLAQCVDGFGQDGRAVADAFVNELPTVHDALIMDATATCEADPAARSIDEVILAYPGLRALACYRFAHQLWESGVPLLARLISEIAHRTTGIDIHPGAAIGRAIAIDHGTGIVIGETSVIGDGVRLYQGVTLGALSVRKDLATTRRHPTIEHDVVIYANATILGGSTVVGHSSVIGGNVWLTHSVPPHSVVTNVAVSERRSADEATPIGIEL